MWKTTCLIPTPADDPKKLRRNFEMSSTIRQLIQERFGVSLSNSSRNDVQLLQQRGVLTQTQIAEIADQL